MKDAKPEAIENRLLAVPTAGERQGNFSRLLAVNPAKHQIYDPLTTRFDAASGQYVRNLFPGNIIPASRQVNPMYKFYEKLYPLPNNPPQVTSEGQYYYFNAQIPYNWDYYAFQGRVGWTPNEKNRFFGRFSKNKFLENQSDWTFETVPQLHRNWLKCRPNIFTQARKLRAFVDLTDLRI